MNNNKYIIGNWKMNPLKKREALDLSGNVDSGLGNLDLKDISVGIAPPFLFLSEINENISNISVGSQDVFWEDGTGAFTGELSPKQLKDAGADFVILGHSERRLYLNESGDEIMKKIKSSLKSDLKAILCVGEPKEVRDKGVDESFEYIKKQIKENLGFLNKEKVKKGQLFIAYEPLWAISTFEGSKPARPGEVEKVISFIKSFVSDQFSLDISVLYGGSTDSDNVESFVKKESVDGVLVGSSSLDSDEFLAMIKILKELE